MNWVSGVVLYIIIWWTALFAILPIGTRPVARADDATGWRGAPERPRMLMKMLVTTAVSAVIWLGAYWVIASNYLSFRDGFLAG